MLIATFSDLRYRLRRFLITVLGTALVFALTLLLAGISSAFGSEARRTVDSIPADGWVVGEDAKGPFLSATPLPDSTVEDVAALDGVSSADGMVWVRQAIGDEDPQDVNVIGAVPGGVGMASADDGRAPESPGEVMVSTRLDADTLEMGGEEFAVVGKISNSSALAGVPNVFITLADGQQIAFAGQPVVTSVAFEGEGPDLPSGLIVVDRDDATSDLLRTVASARSGISLVSMMLWVVAGSIIGSVIYLSALERESDFAVFKATGWSTRALLGGLVVQAVILAVLAAAVGALGAYLLGPGFPLPVDITPAIYLALPAIALAVAVVASAAGLRRITKIDPASAFA